MVIELNADDSDISPLQNLPRDQAAAEDFELGKIKFYIKSAPHEMKIVKD